MRVTRQIVLPPPIKVIYEFDCFEGILLSKHQIRNTANLLSFPDTILHGFDCGNYSKEETI